MGAAWQQAADVVIPANATTAAVFTLRPNCPLDRLTIWVTSEAALTGTTWQLQVNGQDYRSGVAITGVVAAHVIYNSGGGTSGADDVLFPFRNPRVPAADLGPFEVTIEVTSSHGSDQEATVWAVAIQHQGA